MVKRTATLSCTSFHEIKNMLNGKLLENHLTIRKRSYFIQIVLQLSCMVELQYIFQ